MSAGVHRSSPSQVPTALLTNALIILWLLLHGGDPYTNCLLKDMAMSCWTIHFGNISDNRNLIIIINGSRERIGSPDITTRSLVMYSRMLSK